jgi:hypothetical protein
MKPLLFAALSLLAIPCAHAQIAEVYGTVAVDHIANHPNFFNDEVHTNYTSAGATLGGTLNFIPLHVLSVGLDYRQTLCSQRTWLVGFQFMAKPPRLPFKPYIRISAGENHIYTSNQYNSHFDEGSYIYNAAAGVDYRFRPFLDLRLFEIGAGRTLGAGSSNPESMLNFNAGIVFHTSVH